MVPIRANLMTMVILLLTLVDRWAMVKVVFIDGFRSFAIDTFYLTIVMVFPVGL